MAQPSHLEESHVLHCGWTDPRDRTNWHVRSYRDAGGVCMLAFRRASEGAEMTAINRFELACDRLEDHQIAALLDQARKASA
jgi:hypothetical protein